MNNSAPPRLALLPIGAYKPEWFMTPAHISPKDAVRAHQILHSSTSMAIHFGTFPLGDDGQFEPINDLNKALEAQSPNIPPGRFIILEPGEGFDVPPMETQTGNGE